jgi:hypothetical protein
MAKKSVIKKKAAYSRPIKTKALVKKKAAKKKAAQNGPSSEIKNIGLFFGAGAEISYGLPTGGRFAIEIFRRSPEEQKKRFKELLDNIDRTTYYCSSYLPPDFHKKRLNVFGKPDFTNLLQSSIEYRRGQVMAFLNDFDEHALAVLASSGVSQDRFEKLYEDAINKKFGASNYGNAIHLNERLGDDNHLFTSEYFSVFLDILTNFSEERLLRRCLTSFLQLLVGCCGQKLATDLNEQIFTEAPDIPIFDDIGGIFQIEFSQAGLTALEIILEELPTNLDDSSSLPTIASELCRATLEKLFEKCLDYQALLDSHFRYVYDPKASWAKFTKICIFLNIVRDYILEGLPTDIELQNDHDGYYHDLSHLMPYGLSVNEIGTVNYNMLVETICAQNGVTPHVYHLNGSVKDFYDPYLNQIVDLSSPDDDYTEQDHIVVPMLFTQSGIKPLTSIEMSRRYVELFDYFSNCDAIVVVGFGFQADDGHVNGMFRQLIQDRAKEVYICTYSPNAFHEATVRAEFRRKLRLEHDPQNLHFIPVDDQRQTNEGLMWYEAIAQKLD